MNCRDDEEKHDTERVKRGKAEHEVTLQRLINNKQP